MERSPYRIATQALLIVILAVVPTAWAQRRVDF